MRSAAGEGLSGDANPMALTGIFNRLEELSAQPQTPANPGFVDSDSRGGSRTPRLAQMLQEVPDSLLPVNDISGSPIFPGIGDLDPGSLPLPRCVLEGTDTGIVEPIVDIDEHDPPRPWKRPVAPLEHPVPQEAPGSRRESRQAPIQAEHGVSGPVAPPTVFSSDPDGMSAEELLRQAGELLGM